MIWNKRKQLCLSDKDISTRLKKWAEFFSETFFVISDFCISVIYMPIILLGENITTNEKQPVCITQTG
ncbi:hypothetical protein A9D36_05760 [Bacillus subtilis]|nr:hypothetical protein A9D36_05760 [Bacillus subtilis]